MEFGILFTSHPDPETEQYPHREIHQRVTNEIIEAEELGFDSIWIAEHHFSNRYGILPDPFSYLSYLAAKTTRIKLCLLYTSPSPRDKRQSRMPSSA